MNREFSYISRYVKIIQRDYKTLGFIGVFPFYTIYFIFVIPYLISYETEIQSVQAFIELKSPLLALIYFGGALFGSFCIGVMTHIASTSSVYPFSEYMMQDEEAEDYLFFPQYILFKIVLGIFYSTVLFVLSFYFSASFIVFTVSSMFFTFIFTFVWTINLLDILRHFSIFHINYINLLNDPNNSS